jgi:hypothetical protein
VLLSVHWFLPTAGDSRDVIPRLRTAGLLAGSPDGVATDQASGTPAPPELAPASAS